ncbi:MAG: efflux RND transporter periplasmic adaptor subunit [Planctomycetaceae bacterium]|nr:efflux RND transporter periplasmic adaptor subunit [Planctomycetaceae bacterium]
MTGLRLQSAWHWCALALLLASMTGCEKSNAGAEKKAAPPVKVEMATPTEKEVTDFQDFTGRLEAVESVEIRARVSGYLTKIAFDPSIELGAEVEVGDSLFEIDERPYLNTLATADAQLAQATARQKTTAAELARTEELVAKKAATARDLERDVGQNAEAVASIQVASASIAQAKLDLEFAKITAPISGRISRSVPSVGDLITPATGLLTSIVSVDPIHLYFDMDEPTLQTLQKLVREGKLKGPMEGEIPLLMGLTTDDGHPHRGKLDFIENQVDPNTGTIRVRGVFANPKPERGPRPLTPGSFARVRLPVGEPHKAVLISERAIGRNLDQSFVYVVDAENKVVYRPVTLGSLKDGMRVIVDGLTAGERIVTNGLQRVRPGSKVEPQTAAAVEE